MPDKSSPFAFETWWAVFGELNGSTWEGDDLQLLRFYRDDPSPTQPAVDALKYAYDKAEQWEGPVDLEYAVAATLSATYEFYSGNEWAPFQVMEMADHFAVYYQEIEDPLQDWLDEEYSRMPLEWLSDHGRRELEQEIRRPSEIWIDEGTGVWVFNKPGRTP